MNNPDIENKVDSFSYSKPPAPVWTQYGDSCFELGTGSDFAEDSLWDSLRYRWSKIHE